MPNSVGRILAAGGALAASLIGTGASAGEPTPWQMGLQQAATPLMQSIDDLHDILLVICTLITLFVLGLLLYVMWRFRESKNPTPTRTTHNTTVEVLWTVIPVVILVLIAIPSFKLLYYSDTIPKADLTVKAIGHQWYWELRVSGSRQLHLRRDDPGGRRAEGGPAAPAGGRQPHRGAGRQGGPCSGHRRRRAARLGGAGRSA